MKKQRSLIYICLISLLTFILILLDILKKGILTSLDYYVNHFIALNQNAVLINSSKILGIIFDTWCLLAIAILVSAYLWFKDSKKDAFFFSIIMFIGAGIIFVLKELINRARPLNILIDEINSSFPSGHATIAIIFFGVLTYLILKRDHSRFERKIAMIISPIMILIIGFSRIIINAHWLSDVLAGYFLGLVVLTISIILNNKILRRF
jgi:undecaprenyl-diphosphatase